MCCSRAGSCVSRPAVVCRAGEFSGPAALGVVSTAVIMPWLCLGSFKLHSSWKGFCHYIGSLGITRTEVQTLSKACSVVGRFRVRNSILWQMEHMPLIRINTRRYAVVAGTRKLQQPAWHGSFYRQVDKLLATDS